MEKKNLFYSLLAFMFLHQGHKNPTAKAYHEAILHGGNPEFSPRKHTVMSYAQQNRLAKKRRNKKRTKL